MRMPMMSVARRNMVAWKGRMVFSIGGVAVATLLLSFVLALYYGFSSRVAAYVEGVNADVWVVGRGNQSFFNPSVIVTGPKGPIAALEKLDNIETTSQVTQWTLKLQHCKRRAADADPNECPGGQFWDTYIVGYQPGGIVGPLGMKSGSSDLQTGEIIIDDVLARQAGIKIGDEVVAGVRHLEVIGISKGGNLVITQLSFVTEEEAGLIRGIGGFTSFILVTTPPGKGAELVNAINTTPGLAELDAFESADYADGSRQLIERNLLPVLLVIVMLALIVGTIVVGLTVYTAVVEKEREFGVLKAVGTSNGGLLRVVIEQSAVCGAAGFVVGELGALAAASLAQRAVPQFVTLFRVQDVVLVFALAAGMSLVAAVIPIQRIARVDPLTVFKA